MNKLNQSFKKLLINEKTFSKHEFNPRYKTIKEIGSGVFGHVFLVHDLRYNKDVAVKQVQIKKETIKYLCRELICLKDARHPNILCLLDVFASVKSNIVCLVFEYTNRTLWDVIKDKDFKMTQENISFVMYQLFCGINHLHKIGVVHRDLKSRNIGVIRGLQIKILDLGLSRHTAEKMSAELGSKAYRSPEVVAKRADYTEKADMWSAGCIFGEMIIEDMPDFWTESVLSQLKNKAFDWEQKLPDSLFLHYTDCNRLSVVNQINAVNARDLLSKLVAFDPNQRLSAFNATRHPYVCLYWNGDDFKHIARPLFTEARREPTERDLYSLVDEFAT